MVSDVTGLQKLFSEQQKQNQIRHKRVLENADLLKSLMVTKEQIKKSENETDKSLAAMAARQNDLRIEKSQKDYQQLVENKQRLNQLIINASKDNAIRNFSLVERERNGSLERLFEKHQL